MVNNWKEKLELSLSKELNERLTDYAEEKEKSVQTVAREAIEHHLDHYDAKSVLQKSCDEGELRWV